MNKITKEILENHPELEKNKDSLNKAVNSLEELNPKVMVSSEFKKSLKSRLNGLVGIKQNKKSNFVSFMIPVFSFMFVIGGFFYYFKDINFFNQDGSIIESQVTKFAESEIGEINEVVEILEEEVNNFEIEEKNENIKPEVIKEEPSVRSFKISEEKSNTEDNISENKEPALMKSSFRTMILEDNDTANQEVSEDNQLMDILESVELEMESTFDDSMEESEIAPMVEFDGFMDELENGGLMGDMMMDMEESIYSFEDFCKDNKGELSGTGETLKCIKNDIECGSMDFEKGACSFDETK